MANQMDHHVAKRTLTFIIYGGQNEYENYMQVKEWILTNKNIQSLPEFHSFDLQQKFLHVEQQQREIVKFIQKQGGLKAVTKQLSHLYSLIGFDAGRAFQIHSYFASILKEFFKQQEVNKDLLKQVQQLQILGAVLFDEYDFSNNTVIRYYKENSRTKLTRNGLIYTISTAPGIYKSGLYFASNLTGYAITLCTDGTRHYLALIKLKDEHGALLPGVNLKWLGKSLQLINNWAVELTNLPVLEIVELGANWRQQIQVQEGIFLLQEARIQLQDVTRMTFLAVKYCSMRRQFKTMDGDTKTERRVIEYQVTTERLLNAISFVLPALLGLDQLDMKYHSALKHKKEERFALSIFIKQFTQMIIKNSFEIIEHLREAMGGFGYMRFSGAPTIQERALWLYQQQFQDAEFFSSALVALCKDQEENQTFINTINGMGSALNPDQMLQEVGQINDTTVENPFAMYGYFTAKITERFLDTENMQHPQQFISHANDIANTFICTQLFNLLAFRRYRGVNFILDKLFLHHILNELLQTEVNLEHRLTFNKRRTAIQLSLRDLMGLIVDSFEMDETFHDALVGRDNQQEFYTQLIDWAKNHNLRNDPAVKAYILEDLKAQIQRPKL